jgi:16S rRNA (adenine(1408)-N(1))-methyltransferase
LANIEDLPAELNGIANQVFINFPWGTLLKGIISVEDKTWDSIKKICQKGAIIDVLLGYDDAFEKKEVKEWNLPKLDIGYIKNQMTFDLLERGFKLKKVGQVFKEELKVYPSSWARKLCFGRDRYYYYIRLELIKQV